MSQWKRFLSLRTANSMSPDRVQNELVRDVGLPTSSNGASSMHATCLDLPDDVMAVEAVLTIVDPPVTPDLHFWAIQASFVDRGAAVGAGHLGLQWITGHPGGTAVNWGGYRSAGGELPGSESSLPSGRDNPNTRDYPWRSGAPYLLRIERGANGWRGSATDVDRDERTVVRELYAGGTTLASIVMWSEVFSPCEGPTSAVRWSGLVAHTGRRTDGEVLDPVPIHSVKLSYQRHVDGGCTNTDTSSSDRGGIIQRTATVRRNTHGSILRGVD